LSNAINDIDAFLEKTEKLKVSRGETFYIAEDSLSDINDNLLEEGNYTVSTKTGGTAVLLSEDKTEHHVNLETLKQVDKDFKNMMSSVSQMCDNLAKMAQKSSAGRNLVKEQVKKLVSSL